MAPPRVAAQDRPQLKRPIDIPEEKLPVDKEKKPKKNVKGPRAVGVLQLNSNGKGTLIPIAILVDGKFYDAGLYKADPVPMALESGTVYEAEQAGSSQGLFTVRGVLHSKTQGAAHPWLGAGSYLPNGVEGPKTTRKAEDVPVGFGSGGGSSDERPRLTRGNTPAPAASSSPAPAPASSTKDAAAAAKPGTAASPASSQPTSSSSAGASTSQDRPKLATPATSDKPADQNAKQPAPAAGQASPAQSTPGKESQGQASQSQASPSQASPSQAGKNQTSDNYYRPTLRRGKPTESAPEEDLTGLNDKSNTGKPAATGTIAAVSGEPVKLVVAISDAGGPEPRPFKFYWKTGEEDDRRQQMLALATNELQAYVTALATNRIPATPAAPAKKTAAGHKAAAKPAPPVLENVQFRTFDVWLNNQPVLILSAEAHFPPAPNATAAPEQYSITLVARTDIYGNLIKLYSGVTDKFHLDVTPRLEFIDAVDADGDGRGELLFRETTDAGSGYIIYRPTGDKLFKMFDSLSE